MLDGLGEGKVLNWEMEGGLGGHNPQNSKQVSFFFSSSLRNKRSFNFFINSVIPFRIENTKILFSLRRYKKIRIWIWSLFPSPSKILLPFRNRSLLSPPFFCLVRLSFVFFSPSLAIATVPNAYRETPLPFFLAVPFEFSTILFFPSRKVLARKLSKKEKFTCRRRVFFLFFFYAKLRMFYEYIRPNSA